MAQPLGRPPGLHCLLYLSAEQICPPVSGRPGGFAIEFRSGKRPWFVQLLDGWEGGISLRTPWVREARFRPLPPDRQGLAGGAAADC